MQPGWYAHFQEPGAVAYFDGTSWGTARDGFSLSYEIQESITTQPPGHPGPSAPFEALAIPRSRVRRPGSSWFWGVGAGALFILGGIIRGFSDVAGCGSPHQRNYTAEMLDHLNAADGIATAYAAQCRADVAEAAIWMWALITIGVLVALGSVITMAVIRSGHSRMTTVMAPTVAAQIEDLARLRDRGLLSPEEFEWKREELLRRP